MVVECHHVACVCVSTEWKNKSSKKKFFFFWRLGFFFSKLGKKSPKFHWEWGLIMALRTPNKNPWQATLPGCYFFMTSLFSRRSPSDHFCQIIFNFYHKCQKRILATISHAPLAAMHFCLSYFCARSLKEHSCEVWLKFDPWYSMSCHLKQFNDDGWLMKQDRWQT